MNSHVAVARLQRAPDSYAVSFALAAKAGLIDAQLAARLSPSAAMRNVLVHSTWNWTTTWRLIHKSNLMTVTTPSPSDVSVTL